MMSAHGDRGLAANFDGTCPQLEMKESRHA